MPNGYTNMSNYEAYKAGTGRKGYDLHFITPLDIGVKYMECIDLFKISRFIGTKEECKRNLRDYPEHKIV